MENRGLLFIPDISGFTRFVNATALDHSRRIVQELLELLINANQIGLEVSEVEGDAVLFYRFGQAPRLDQVYQQVETMFCAFHRHLLAYDHNRYCYCQACNAARELTLKVVTHYGEFTGYQVRNFRKLIGTAVIVAHQLLKNDIAQHEYWLVTAPLAGQEAPPAGFAPWMQWTRSATQTDSGQLPFHYTQLGQLKTQLTPEPSPRLGLDEKIRVLSLSREYETDLRTLLHATADFRHRSRWQEGVKTVAEVDNHLPRVGMRCRCVMEDDGPVDLYASSYSYSADRAEFSETDEQKTTSTSFTLEKIGPKSTRLTIDVYLKKGRARQAWFALTRRARMHRRYRQSMLNLEHLAKEIAVPAC